jgi:hypothetical protein
MTITGKFKRLEKRRVELEALISKAEYELRILSIELNNILTEMSMIRNILNKNKIAEQ